MTPTAANAADNRIGCSTDRHMAAMRLASLTAGPTTVKSSRSRAADIAVENLSDMQAEIHVGDRLALLRRALVQLDDAWRAAIAAASAAVAGMRAVFGGEDRKRAVADQLEHIAALVVDRRDDDVGIVVRAAG